MISPPTFLLRPLSAIYGAVTRARLTAYRRRWFSVSELPVPVISVGNLTTGGTGKTPLVNWVCRVLADTQSTASPKRVCVLTRGYGRADPASQVLVSNGNEVLADERAAGDEPHVLAQDLVGVAAVISNADRLAAGNWALQNLRSEVFVLDDGFQHLRLARDLDIVTIDATNPWGGGGLLPFGRLREPSGGLSRADCVVITRTEQVDKVSSLKEAILSVSGGIPVFTSRMLTAGIRTVSRQTVVDKANLPQPVAAFCGVGNPDSFFEHLRREGYTPVLTRAFPDHHRYTQSDLDWLVNGARAQGAKSLLTTAKDATKLTHLQFELPCFVLEIQISIDDEERLIEMIRTVCRAER